MACLRYGPEIEQPAADEQKTIDGIIQGTTQQSDAVESASITPSACRGRALIRPGGSAVSTR